MEHVSMFLHSSVLRIAETSLAVARLVHRIHAGRVAQLDAPGRILFQVARRFLNPLVIVGVEFLKGQGQVVELMHSIAAAPCQISQEMFVAEEALADISIRLLLLDFAVNHWGELVPLTAVVIAV